MARQHILVVDDDQKSLQVLEISLKKAGFLVTTAANGLDGLDKAKTSMPELIISDVKMPKMNGYQFCKRVKEDPTLRHIPFIFLSSQRSVDDKIKGLELGVDDYLTKPIYIRELLTRVRLLMQKKEKESIEQVGDQTRFAGKLTDMGVVDLLQTLEIGRKTGVLYVTSGNDLSGLVYFRDGQAIDAIQSALKGASAIYRMLTWGDGAFKIDFKPINRQQTINESTQGVIMEGMRRLDEWERLAEQLPPFETVLVIDPQELLTQYPDKFPDKAGKILQLFDGKRSILEVVDRSGLDDLPALDVVSRLYFQGLLKELDRQAEPVAHAAAPPPQAQPEPLPPEMARAAAPSAPAPPSGEPESMDVRALLARSGVGPAAPGSEPTPPPTARPGNGSPDRSLADLAQPEQDPLAPTSAPAPVARPDAIGRGEEKKQKEKKPKEEKKAKAPKTAKVLAPEEPQLVAPALWQRRPLLAGALAGAGVVLLALLAALGFGALEPLGVRPLGEILAGVPSLDHLEAEAASHAQAPLGRVLAEIERLGPGRQGEPAVAGVKARALLRLGALEGSLDERLGEADAALRVVAAAGQDDPAVQLAWAEYEVARGEFGSARTRSGRLAASANPQVAARAAYVGALADLGEGEKGGLGRSIESLDAASKVLGQDAGVRIALAEVLLEVANYKDARQRAEQAIALSPEAAPAHKALARACEALGDSPCADQSWQQAVSLAPGDADAALGQASYIWQDKKDAAGAKSRLAQIVANPAWSGETAILARAYFLLGEIADGRGNKDEALSAFERVRNLDPTYPGLAARLAELRPKPKPEPVADPRTEGRKALRQGRFRAAIPLLEEATERHPQDDSLFADLGMAYLQIDQSRNAQRALEKALTINPDNVTSLRWLGQIYTTLGRKQAAAGLFRRFLKLAPDHPDTPLVQALLRRLGP